MFSPNKKMVMLSAIAVFFIIIDRWFKATALRALSKQDFPIADWLCLKLKLNQGVAFSISMPIWMIIFLSLIIIILLLFFYIKTKNQRDFILAGWLSWIILGSFSNLFDRIKYQAVVDYIDIKYFTVFNLADVLICCGAFALIALIWRKPKTQSSVHFPKQPEI